MTVRRRQKNKNFQEVGGKQNRRNKQEWAPIPEDEDACQQGKAVTLEQYRDKPMRTL